MVLVGIKSGLILNFGAMPITIKRGAREHSFHELACLAVASHPLHLSSIFILQFFMLFMVKNYPGHSK